MWSKRIAKGGIASNPTKLRKGKEEKCFKKPSCHSALRWSGKDSLNQKYIIVQDSKGQEFDHHSLQYEGIKG